MGHIYILPFLRPHSPIHTSRHPELRIPAHSHPTSLPCTLRLSHTHTPRSRKPKLSFLPRSPTPGPLAPSPRHPAPSLDPATPGQRLGVTSPRRLTSRTHTARARPPIHTLESSARPQSPLPAGPLPHSLWPSNLRMMVSRKVFCGATWPLRTGILSPWAGRADPHPPRPGPAQHRLPVARPGRGPRTPRPGRARAGPGLGCGRGVSARRRLRTVGPAWSCLSSGRPAARTPVCRPQPSRGPPSAASPRCAPPARAPGSRLPPAAPTAAPAPAAGAAPAARPGRGRVNAARAPRAPAPASRLPPARRAPAAPPSPPTQPARPPFPLAEPSRGLPPPQPLAQPRSPRDSRAPRGGRGP